jgi:hypothetical protein
MPEMTSRERLRAALLGEPVDHVPFSPNLAYLFETLPSEYQDLGHMGFSRLVGADLLNRFAPCPTRIVEPDGVTWREGAEGERVVKVIETPVGTLRMAFAPSAEGGTNFLVEHPLKAEEDYRTYQWLVEHRRIELDPAVLARRPEEDVLEIGVLVPDACKSGFQFMVEHLVGTEELAYALCDFPATVAELLHVLQEKNRTAVRLAAESAPYEFFLTWEDSSTQNYSPEMYGQHIAPEIAAWCRILAGHGKRYIQHACGHVRALLPIMRGEGILAVESLSPAPTGNLTLKEARSLLGPDIGIVGGIEPTELLGRSLKDLGPYVEQVVEDGRGGPFVLANSDSCPPGVTIEKFRLIADIARRTSHAC